MSLLGRLARLFIVVPLIELILLVELGRRIGLLPTLALVIVTGITGATMARLEGLRVFFQFQIEMGSGRLPGQAMLDGVSVLIGGAFLLTPGIFTDLVGFALLFPFSRRWLQRYAKAWMKKKVTDGTIHMVKRLGERVDLDALFCGFGRLHADMSKFWGSVSTPRDC